MKLKKLMLLGATTLLASTTILAGCSKKTETPTITPSESGSQGTSTITPSSSISSPVESSTAPVISIYTVSFNLNTGEELDPQKVKKGEAVAKPSNPSRSGYVFAGWYLDEECNNAYDFASPVNSDLILYAKWEEVKKDTYLLTIEYHIGEDVKYDVISNPKLVSFITPSFNDYTFIGYVDEAGADVSLDSVRALELTENKTIVLKAKFDKELEYVNVTLKNGEENNVERLVKGELLNNVVDPSKDGYLFEGWFESSEDTKAFDFSQTTIVSDITLVARFKEINKLNTTHFDNCLKKDGPLTENVLPSLGSPKVLVIPVNLDNTKKTDEVRNSIVKAFKGTEKETGWESVMTYYQKSSYNKLNLDFEVTEWFTPSKTASEYNRQYQDESANMPSDDILDEALTHFDSAYDFSDYDLDNDGYIDSVWLIYNSPVDYQSNDSFYWAFTTQTESTTTFDSKKASYYAFAGTDFITPNQEDASYDVSDLTYDAHTYIHETGHLLGLDDYYDYDSEQGALGCLYGADMMDYNIGDHGPINKMLLGWVDPCVVSETTTIRIDDFSTTGNVLLVTNKTLSSIYDEYFLIEFYNGSGLNNHDLQIINNINKDEATDAIGVRVTHVNATKKTQEEIDNDKSQSYFTGFKYNNSETDELFIDTMLQKKLTDEEKLEYFADQDALYTPTSNKFGIDVYQNYISDSLQKLFFTMTVDSMDETGATVTITFKSLAGSGSAVLPWI